MFPQNRDFVRYSKSLCSDGLEMPSETYFHKFSGEIIHTPKITM